MLDLGCGTGNVALLAAAAGAQVTAVDPSPRLLDVTSAAAQRENLDVTCEVGEAAAVPSPDDSFDCLLSNFGVIFAPEPEAAAAEIGRIVRADGRARFTAWLPGGAVGHFQRRRRSWCPPPWGRRQPLPASPGMTSPPWTHCPRAMA